MQWITADSENCLEWPIEENSKDNYDINMLTVNVENIKYVASGPETYSMCFLNVYERGSQCFCQSLFCVKNMSFVVAEQSVSISLHSIYRVTTYDVSLLPYLFGVLSSNRLFAFIARVGESSRVRRESGFPL